MTSMLRYAAMLAAFAVFPAAPAAADGKVEARYAVSINGIGIGQGALVVEVSDTGYSAAGSATVTGLLKLVAPGKGSAAVRGQFVDGKVQPVNYSISSESGEKWEDIRLGSVGGFVRDVVILPPPNHSKDRIPITDEHRRNVVDPMSAALLPVVGSGEMSGADACERTVAIFDGRQRYDLVFTFERNEPAKDLKGYSGQLSVCRIAYHPVAGHRANRQQVKNMAENRNIFAWLAPIAGTRVLLPVRVTIATVIGTLVVQATQFAGEPRERSAVNPGAK